MVKPMLRRGRVKAAKVVFWTACDAGHDFRGGCKGGKRRRGW